jgi:hypothetical protein
MDLNSFLILWCEFGVLNVVEEISKIKINLHSLLIQGSRRMAITSIFHFILFEELIMKFHSINSANPFRNRFASLLAKNYAIYESVAEFFLISMLISDFIKRARRKGNLSKTRETWQLFSINFKIPKVSV